MTTSDIINGILAGGLLGTLGQGIRIAVGLKKLHTDNSIKASQGDDEETISSGRLLLSIFIGFIAGALGMLIKGYTLNKGAEINREAIVTIIALGYSGADFIEGVLQPMFQSLPDPLHKQIILPKK
ncbi:MAG: hypothetical protein WDM71_07905 [Ferruginibacter sp.]